VKTRKWLDCSKRVGSCRLTVSCKWKLCTITPVGIEREVMKATSPFIFHILGNESSSPQSQRIILISMIHK
jgi:hypothetical protein